MGQIYLMLDNDAEKCEYINSLKKVASKTKFESYKIYLSRFQQAIEDKKGAATIPDQPSIGTLQKIETLSSEELGLAELI